MSKNLVLAPPPPKHIRAAVHEAASRGRRLSSFGTRSVSPNSVVSEDLDILQRRSAASARDNPWVSRGLAVAVTNEVGTGIVPRPTTPDVEFNNSMLDLYKDYVYYADYVGSLSIYGIQSIMCNARRSTGESFTLIKRLRADRNLDVPIPIQFQTLESAFCPWDLNRDRLSNGNRVITGIEVNRFGRKVAFWFYKRDPRESGLGHMTLDMVRVPATDVIHHFKPTRPGQLRAVPEIVQGLVKAHTFESYNDSELERKSTRANFTGTIERPDYGEADFKFDPLTGAPLNKDHADVPLLELEPGTFPNLLPGEVINVFDGDDAGRGYGTFQRWQLLGISAGVDVPYQLVSGDWDGINDRVWRAVFTQFKREIMTVQNLYIIPQVCRIMWQEIVNRAIVTGRITPPNASNKFETIRAKHRPQAWEYLHPVQDVDADIKKINAGLKSRTGVVDERNDEDSAEDVDIQRKVDNDRASSLGLDIADE